MCTNGSTSMATWLNAKTIRLTWRPSSALAAIPGPRWNGVTGIAGMARCGYRPSAARLRSGGLDPVELIEHRCGRLERQHLEGEAPLQRVQTGLTLELIQESTRSHPSRRHVRAGEQAAIRVEVVQPRRPDHLQGPIRRAMQMPEEGGQL